MDQESLLIFNPASGRGAPKERLLPRLLECLRRFGIDPQIVPTQSPGEAARLARDAAARKVSLVIAWGGDGTLNEMARGLLQSNSALGIIPGGTVNVFARETGIPLHPLRACEILARGERKIIPVGVAAGQPFLLMAGIGLDGAVVRQLNLETKRRLGVAAFWLEGFRKLAAYHFSPLAVRAGGREYEGTTLIAGKIRLYGTGYVITPDARLEEPLLDVVLFQGRRGIDYLRYLAGVAGGFHLRFKDVVHFKTERLEVHSVRPVHYQLDGEAAGATPVELGVIPQALTVVLPGPVRKGNPSSRSSR